MVLVPVVSRTAVSPSVYVVGSTVNLPGVPDLVSLLLSTSLLLLIFPPVLVSLLLLVYTRTTLKIVFISYFPLKKLCMILERSGFSRGVRELGRGGGGLET